MARKHSVRVSRREFLAGTALATGAFFLNGRSTRVGVSGPPPSPPTTPFVNQLAFAPWATPLAPGVSLNPLPIPENHQRWDEYAPVKYYDLPIAAVLNQPHPQLPASLLFGYGGSVPGPTFMMRYDEPVLVRWRNQLPAQVTGFGSSDVITHIHNGHNASESDGFPTDFYGPGYFKDHHYTNHAAGDDPLERKGTLWYQDHRLEYTAQNTYRGLAGWFLLFHDLDSGNENDSNLDAFRLPSGVPNGGYGAGCYDIPLALTDRQYDQNGYLFMDVMEMGGHLGDKALVNGQIQPYMNVERRKYRFRMLCGGPSRYLDMWFSNEMPFLFIANDGNLLPAPIVRNHVYLSIGERADIVVDFSQLPANVSEIYLVNRLEQTDGRKPEEGVLPIAQSTKFLKLNILPAATPVPDPSRVPTTLMPLPALNLPVARRRTWVFNRTNGMWAVNGNLFDPNRSDATVRQNTAEVWTLKNGGGGWAHPIHIHLEEYHLLERNRRPVTSGVERSRKDVFDLAPGDEVKIYMKFRDFLGRYPMHCHNTIHEDHAMMVRFDIVP